MCPVVASSAAAPTRDRRVAAGRTNGVDMGSLGWGRSPVFTHGLSRKLVVALTDRARKLVVHGRASSDAQHFSDVGLRTRRKSLLPQVRQHDLKEPLAVLV